jgi:hypothetical protein
MMSHASRNMLVEIKWINVRRNTTVFSICWRKQLHVSALFWVAIIRLRLEHREKLIYYNVDIKHEERDLVLQSLGRSVAIYMRCGLCDVYDFICRVFCKFIDTWAGVIFERCFGKRLSVRSWLGRLRKWLLWRRQSGLWSSCLRGGLDNWIFVWRCVCYVCEGYYLRIFFLPRCVLWVVIQIMPRSKRLLLHCSIWVFPDVLVSTWWWATQKRAETCSCFLQEIENTIVLRRTFRHLISTSIESHHGDDANKESKHVAITIVKRNYLFICCVDWKINKLYT